MKIELTDNKVFFEKQGSKKEIHPFWLRERVNSKEFLDQKTQQRLFDPTMLSNNTEITKLKMSENIEQKCLAKGVKLTDQRKIIAKVMSESNDHPDVDELYNRVSKIDPKISIATVYRTVKLFEESGILAKHDFKGGKARYEELNEGHHDHLIDVKSGEIIEFVDEEIEKLQEKIADKYGYRLVDHKLELYGVKKKS